MHPVYITFKLSDHSSVVHVLHGDFHNTTNLLFSLFNAPMCNIPSVWQDWKTTQNLIRVSGTWL